MSMQNSKVYILFIVSYKASEYFVSTLVSQSVIRNSVKYVNFKILKFFDVRVIDLKTFLAWLFLNAV